MTVPENPTYVGGCASGCELLAAEYAAHDATKRRLAEVEARFASMVIRVKELERLIADELGNMYTDEPEKGHPKLDWP